MNLADQSNRAFVLGNSAQGQFRRVLCVCSAGVLRSPTAAWVFSNAPFNFNTRSAGTEDFALVRVDAELLRWAEDGIVCMELKHAKVVDRLLEKHDLLRTVHILNIPDHYDFRDPRLVSMLKNRGELLFKKACA